MRAIGPGSVSSLLKIALDAAYVILWLAFAALVIAGLTALLIPLPSLTATIMEHGAARQVELKRSLIVFSLLGFSAYVGGFILIIRHLRRLFKTMTAGDPFHPDNVGRLRVIGLALAGLAAAEICYRAIAGWLAPGVVRMEGTGDPIPWFSVLVVFVLAEVFREGSRLRRDAELTI